MKKEDKVLIHIRLDESEIIRFKRDILMLELEVLRILKTIDSYKKLRVSELDKKNELKKNLKEVNNSIRTLKTKVLPKLQIEKKEQRNEKRLKEKTPEKKPPTKKIIPKKSQKKSDDLDSELSRIQEELQRLQ